MSTVQIAGRLLAADTGSRVLRYLLLPFGSEGRTNLGRLTASESSVTIPEDLSGLTVNLEHDESAVVGKFESVTKTTDGLEAEIRVLATRAGDDALTEAAEGVRTGISVELDRPLIRAGRLIAGVLDGAAMCRTPAFPDARLLASDVGDLPDDFPEYNLPAESSTESTDEITVNGVTYVVKRTTTSKTEVDAKSGTAPSDEPETPAESEPDVNARLAATAAPIPTHGGTSNAQTSSAGDMFRLLASAHREGGPARLTAALADIVPANVVAMEQPQFVGELWNGKAYQRRIVPLFNHASLTGLKVQGWRWVTKPVVAPYAGNKTAVPSNTVATEQVPITAERIAGAHDIDRKHRDFNDEEFWRAYYAAMTESYAQVSDTQVLADVVTAAQSITPGDVPAGVSPAMAAIVDGALAVLQGTRTLPTFAIVAVDLYRDILLTREDDTLTYLNAALGLEDGTVQTFKVVPALGGELESGQVLVGARDAVTVHELGETPIRVEAENIAQGGIDAGVFGYYAVNVHDEDGLALVDTTGE